MATTPQGSFAFFRPEPFRDNKNTRRNNRACHFVYVMKQPKPTGFASDGNNLLLFLTYTRDQLRKDVSVTPIRKLLQVGGH